MLMLTLMMEFIIGFVLIYYEAAHTRKCIDKL